MEKEINITRNGRNMKVLLCGPECSGKTELCNKLNQYYGAKQIPEYAVEYLDKLDRNYQKEDLLLIAKEHFEIYTNVIEEHELLFFDTFLLNIKLWSQFKFNWVDPWIEQTLTTVSFDCVLLLKPNLLWEHAKYRENPKDRLVLFDLYLNEMKTLSWPYHIVDKLSQDRFEQARGYVDSERKFRGER